MEAGGLYILGTERHESRRIDNQLRGRSGRQGDPGESRFFLSAEDDLVRLFAGDRIYRILDRLGPTGDEGEEEPIEAKMLSKQIEGAQKKVEEQNFLIRKRVLEYDDVMNQQREIIYEYRDKILEGEDMSETAREQLAEVVERHGRGVHAGRLPRELGPRRAVHAARADVPGGPRPGGDGPQQRRPRRLDRRAARGHRRGLRRARGGAGRRSIMRALERFMLLQIIDERWREHLHDMDYLREGIHLRGFAQIEPLVAYKNEGFDMFTELMNSIWEEFARYIFVVEIEVDQEDNQPAQSAAVALGRLHRTPAPPRPSATPAAAPRTSPALWPPPGQGQPDGRGRRSTTTRSRSSTSRRGPWPRRIASGRNDPCPCGSGKKYKKCHGAA